MAERTVSMVGANSAVASAAGHAIYAAEGYYMKSPLKLEAWVMILFSVITALVGLAAAVIVTLLHRG